MKKNKRPKLLTIIAVLYIVVSIIGAISSLPYNNLYSSIKQGGIVVEDKVRIIEVQPNTPAVKAQLMTGDYVISVNDKTIASSNDFVEIIAANRGEEITVVVERDGQTITSQLVPRTNSPPNEGSVGVLLTDTKIKDVPLYQLVPQVIIRGYFGQEETPTLLLSSYNSQDKSYTRLKSLVFSVIGVIIGIGLWRLKKWAMYGYLLFAAYALFAFLPNLLNLDTYNMYQPQSLISPSLNKPTQSYTLIYIFGYVIEVLLAVYVFSKRKLFK